MASSRRIAGIISVKVDGRPYQAAGPWTFSVASTSRESVLGASDVAGFKETPVAPFAEGALIADRATSLETLQAIEDATISIEAPGGRLVTIRNAWFVDRAELDTGEGQIKVRFEGLSGDEVMPS